MKYDSVNDFFGELSAANKMAARAKTDIALALRTKRTDMGMSQQEFAQHFGISQGLVSRWESGDCNFTIEKLCEVCELFGFALSTPVISPEQTSSSFASSSTIVFLSVSPLVDTAAKSSDFDYSINSETVGVGA